MTSVKDLIEDLKKQPQDAEVMLWKWTDKGTTINHISLLLRPLAKNNKYYQIGINEMMPEINQEVWHKMIEE